MAAFSALALGVGIASTAVGTVTKIGAAGQKAEAAEQTQGRIERIRREARETALPTAAEVKTLDALTAQRESAVKQGLAETQRFEESVSAIDPVIREASEQQFQLLKGRAADILKPVRAARERRKAQLEQQLASSLGSGFRSSTAGVQALIGFDQATDELMAQTQFNALNQLGQTAQGAAATRGALVNQLATISGIGTNLTLAEFQARGSLQQRELQSILSAPVPDAGAALRARGEGLGELGGFFQQVGGTGIGFGLGGPAATGAKKGQAGVQGGLTAPPVNLETPQFGSSLSRPSQPFVAGGIVNPLREKRTGVLR